MPNWFSQLRSMYLNQVQVVTRVGVAADCATQHLVPMFDISGGDVEILGIIGKVVFVKAATAQTIELGHFPTGGARAILATASATTTGDVANKYYTFDGIIGSQLVVAQTGNLIGLGAVGSVLLGTSRASNVFCPGRIDFTTAGADDVTGLINWTILYKPMSIASRVAAA